MNIYEALKSGKRYRRPPGKKYDPNFWYPALCPSYIADRTIRTMFTFEDMIADDWEVEEVRVTITESVLKAAWEKAVKSSGYHDDYSPHGWLYAELKKELGL